MHPVDELLQWLSDLDFAVLVHGLAEHGRDYVFVVQDMLGGDPGTHELTFTHCVKADYETRVLDHVWPESWAEEFTDYATWKAAGEPDGYVWGTNWSNAYPGLAAVPESADAALWNARLGRPMHEMTLETDRFFLRLVFHSIRTRRLSDDIETISQVHIPLGPADS